MRRRWELWAVIFVLLTGIWGIAGLWKIPGLPTSHDSISHVARLYAYEEGLRDGVFPVLWARRMFWGIGSPVLMLNYQIPYYFAMLWHSLGFSLTDSFKLVLSLSQIMSGIFMYFTLRLRYKIMPSLVGSVLYMIAPYRLLNIYVRGALGEVFAIMFPPLILSGIWRKSLPLQTIGWAGLFLSHPVGSAIYSGVFLGYVLILAKLKDIWVTLKQFFVPYLLAFVISSFNLLPTLALTKYTFYTPTDSHPLENFPTLSQLVYSNWGYGFSTSDEHDEMSFQIGVIQWFLAVVMIGIIIYRWRRSTVEREPVYYLFVFVFALFLMLQKLATPLYRAGLMQIIDYPWRILMVYSFLSALMGAYCVEKLKSTFWKLFLVIFLLAGALYTNRNHIRINLVWPWPSDSFRHATGDALGEYATIYRATRDASHFYELAEFDEGTGDITIVKDLSHSMEVDVISTSNSVVRLNMMYFPGWHVILDGQETVIDDRKLTESFERGCYVTKRTLNHIDDSGLIACHLEPGKHSILVRYQALPIQRVGNLLTLAGIGGYLWILFRSFYPRSTSAKQ